MHLQKIKKYLVVSAAVFSLVLVSGCGSDTNTDSTEVSEAASEEVQEEAASDKTSGEVYGPVYQEREEASEEEESEEEKESEESEETEGISENEGTLSAPSKEGGDSVFGSSGADADSDTSEEADAEMQTLLSTLSFPADNGTWALYIYDCAQNTAGSYNDHQMQAASVIKLFIMGAVYSDYSNITAQYGQSNVDSNLNSMITVSDNDAANTLVSYLGGGDNTAGMQAVNDYCAANGYYNTHMGRMLLASNDLDDNYTSVGDCGNFLKAVYQGNASGDSVCQAEFSLLAAQTRRNKIPAQLSGVSVANKTGELSDVENDAGIIYNTSHDLILVFMSENLVEVGSAQNTIASISRQIYDYYNQ